MLCQGNCACRRVYGAHLLPGHIWVKLRPVTNVCVCCKHRGKGNFSRSRALYQHYSDAPTGDIFLILMWLISRWHLTRISSASQRKRLRRQGPCRHQIDSFWKRKTTTVAMDHVARQLLKTCYGNLWNESRVAVSSVPRVSQTRGLSVCWRLSAYNTDYLQRFFFFFFYWIYRKTSKFSRTRTA